LRRCFRRVIAYDVFTGVADGLGILRGYTCLGYDAGTQALMGAG
jgi:hypothetical protein